MKSGKDGPSPEKGPWEGFGGDGGSLASFCPSPLPGKNTSGWEEELRPRGRGSLGLNWSCKGHSTGCSLRRSCLSKKDSRTVQTSETESTCEYLRERRTASLILRFLLYRRSGYPLSRPTSGLHPPGSPDGLSRAQSGLKRCLFQSSQCLTVFFFCMFFCRVVGPNKMGRFS